MKEVKAYECSDGSVKTNKRDALIWERTLELRGVLQRNGMAKDGSFTPTTAATEIVKNFEDIQKIIKSSNRKIRAAELAMLKFVNVS